jgi:thioredoxin reductase
MTKAAAFLVRRLGLSGFVGFDFMIHAGSGQAYLLEMNGRPTPISHIALNGPTDMISALAQPFAVTRKVPNIDSPTVALFPQEMWRDPESGYLRSAYHDVPQHAAEFVTFYADPVAPEPENRLQQVAAQYVRGLRSDSKVGRSARSQCHEPAGRCVHERVAEPSAVHSMKGTATMLQTTDVAIVGAGPYGLSIAAHLSQLGVPFRIFGKPMESWLTQMPRGMLLKSEGFASSIYHPEDSLTLGQYCQEERLPYADIGLPVPLETFCEYGLAFQRQFVSTLEAKLVTAVDRSPSGFTVKLDSGETVGARRVIVAAGISHFSYVPSSIEGAPRKFVSHSSEHADLTAFRGSDVVVLGGGASAVDVAALLHEAGANAQLVARRPALELHSKGDGPRSLWRRLRAPNTGIGPSWKSWFFTYGATVFHRLPEGRRLKWVQTHLGPAGGWFMTDRINCVPQLLGYTPIGAKVIGNRVRLELATEGGHCSHTIEADHVIAATGYRPRLDRLTFIQPRLRAAISMVVNTPILSAHFQSSVAGLYFVGPIAANSFGPLMRFAVGAKYTARRLSQHLVVNH